MTYWLFLAAIVNSAYLALFATPSIFYMANVLAHLALGAALLVVCRGSTRMVLAASALPAVVLIVVGNTTDQAWLLYTHIAIAVGACIVFFRESARAKVLVAGLALLCAGATYLRPARMILNGGATPISMQEEGEGPKSPFWPSSARTNTGLVPSNYFLDSEQCGTCHKDIYDQWKSSMHHFASFNNQFYRKSIEFMQEKQGSTLPSRWCAGCHDHAVLFSGRWERPIKDQIDTPEAQAGLSCLSCHAMQQVHDTMGNAGFTLEYNWLHEIAASKNRYVQAFDRFLTYLNPKPHRKTFLKPMHKSSEYCSTCHKVHLDEPVNRYRWIRGFNDYDNWQASGVSGKGARSFYYPPQSLGCSDCHMPLVDSKDPGNRGGKVHSHRFPGANTAVPLANHDKAQLEVTRKFLESGFIGIDIFAASPVEDLKGELQMKRRKTEPSAMSSFAVGEEAESNAPVVVREVGRVAAPLGKETRIAPGSTVRVDVVVRTKRIGHFFPGGTVDAFDVWIEFEALDANGKPLFWSGRVEENGLGPVERGAHFYRSYQLDGEGNHINKRNAWQTRSVLYVRLIPPGAADTAHYRVKVPKDAKGPILLRAKLNYRKFSHEYTKFAYEHAPNVSGAMKQTPDVPIVELARATVQVGLGEPDWKQVVRPEDYQRWNDWGIGMLLQGDLKGAEYAFRKVMEAKPDYADGPLNVARALIQEGETEAARVFVAKAKRLQPQLARVLFFEALIEKAAGNYESAVALLQNAEAQYPEDRVVLNQLGRVHFLSRRYATAVEILSRVLRIDPEDLQAHYNLMLAYRGLGRIEEADRHARLFQRFKADEASQTLTAKARAISPEDNNERQMIHDHESVPLP